MDEDRYHSDGEESDACSDLGINSGGVEMDDDHECGPPSIT
jgi:hypothetical protein